MPLKNDLLLRAATGQPVERLPVWIMRQAGRILPEYRAVRAQAGGFIEMVTTPELAAEVTIQPVDILGVDAAIIFSDILVVAEAMGLPYEMVEARGPRFPKTVRNLDELKTLRVGDGASDLGYVGEAIKLTKKELADRVPLIGFAGAPFTLFAYMTEGGGSKTFSIAKRLLYADPQFSHALLDMITQTTISYLKSQIAAGADLIQIFDSWAGILGPEQYREFSLKYISQICDAITEVPVTVFAKGAFYSREDFGKLSCSVVGLDWNMPARESRALVGPNKTLQGNLDPCVLYAPLPEVKRLTEEMIREFGPDRYIVNLGHGLYPDIPVDAVKCFVETVQGFDLAQLR